MSFVGLFSGLTGVRAAQLGIDVASHNVANANTSDYTRQRVELTARTAYDAPQGKVGTGVDVAAITRLRDAFLDDRFRVASSDAAASELRSDLLSRLEGFTGEPDNGIADALGRLWDATEAWANAPADDVERRRVLSELDAVSARIRTVADDWSQLGVEASDQRDATLADVEHTLEALADLDQRVANTDPSRIGPDIFDRRDALLDELARLTGARVGIGDDGRVEATLDGVTLIDTAGIATFAINGDDIEVTPPSAGAATVVDASGALGGAHEFLTQDLGAFRTLLDDVATALVDDINAANADGVDEDGFWGQDLLELADPSDPAGTIRLRSDADDPAVLAAGSGPGDGSVVPEPHDGTNARRFTDLAVAAHPDRSGNSIATMWEDAVVELAGTVRAATMAGDVADGVAGAARLARAAEHGVSIDEEMVDLVRYQRALEASTRVMTTVDEALDVLVNRLGVVGR